MDPGEIAFTRMLALPHSRGAVRVMDRMPALDAPYAPVCSEDTSPPTDDQLMIEPPPLSTMAGIPHLLPSTKLLRFCRTTCAFSSSPVFRSHARCMHRRPAPRRHSPATPRAS